MSYKIYRVVEGKEVPSSIEEFHNYIMSSKDYDAFRKKLLNYYNLVIQRRTDRLKEAVD